MNIKCPKCGIELELPDGAIQGMSEVRCGSCREKFLVSPDGTTSLIETYNLPLGADWDVPGFNEKPLPYSYAITTTGFAQAEVECEECHKKFNATFRTMIDATDEPRYETAISSGDYFRFKCPHCGKIKIVIFKVMIWNLRRNYFIRTIFEDRELQGLHQKKSITAEALGLPHDALAHARQRLVWKIPGLIEKVRIFAAGLDDYVIEGQKQILIAQNKQVGAQAARFGDLEGDKMTYFFDLADGRSGSLKCGKDLYDRISAQFSSIGSFKEGILRWVDMKMMQGNYDDWFED